MLKPKAKPGPFGTPTQITKFGSERIDASKLPAVAMRELVLIEPTGKVRYFSSFVDDPKNPDSVVIRTLGFSLIDALSKGWIAIHNSTARIPTVTLIAGYDMSVNQLTPFRTVLGRYKANLAIVIVRTYNPVQRSYLDLGQFRTIWGAEMSARGG